MIIRVKIQENTVKKHLLNLFSTMNNEIIEKEIDKKNRKKITLII